MGSKYATYFSYGLLHQRETTIAEFRAALSRFSRDQVVYLCSAINAVLQSWLRGIPHQGSHEAIVRMLFESHTADQLVAGSQRKEEPYFVFHRQQLLFIAKEAILFCPDVGDNPLAHAPGLFGDVFLMANDHQYYGFESTDDRERKLTNSLTEVMPVGEYSGHRSLRNAIARSHLMYTRLSAELSSHPDYVPILAKFGESIGMEPAEFLGLCFGVLWKYMNVTVESFAADPESFFLKEGFFSQTATTGEKLEVFKKELSANPAKLKDAFEEHAKGSFDFTPFRASPLVEARSHLFCVDPLFLAEKLETGPFWRVNFALDDSDQREKLHRFWGHLFERYMNWLFANSIDSSGRYNQFYPSPKYDSEGTEVCDGIIVSGTTAVFMEYKGSTITAEAKYSGDPSRLEKEIEAKLVRSPKGKRKGLQQLAESIRRTCGRGSVERVQGVDLSHVRTIYPLLITRDPVGDYPLVNAKLLSVFREIPTLSFKTVRPRKLAPLFCLSAGSVEYIAGYLNDARLGDILEARYEANKGMGTPFWATENSILDGLGERENPLLEQAFHGFTGPMVKALFPTEFAADQERRERGNGE